MAHRVTQAPSAADQHIFEVIARASSNLLPASSGASSTRRWNSGDDASPSGALFAILLSSSPHEGRPAAWLTPAPRNRATSPPFTRRPSSSATIRSSGVSCPGVVNLPAFGLQRRVSDRWRQTMATSSPDPLPPGPPPAGWSAPPLASRRTHLARHRPAASPGAVSPGCREAIRLAWTSSTAAASPALIRPAASPGRPPRAQNRYPCTGPLAVDHRRIRHPPTWLLSDSRVWRSNFHRPQWSSTFMTMSLGTSTASRASPADSRGSRTRVPCRCSIRHRLTVVPDCCYCGDRNGHSGLARNPGHRYSAATSPGSAIAPSPWERNHAIKKRTATESHTFASLMHDPTPPVRQTPLGASASSPQARRAHPGRPGRAGLIHCVCVRHRALKARGPHVAPRLRRP